MVQALLEAVQVPEATSLECLPRNRDAGAAGSLARYISVTRTCAL